MATCYDFTFAKLLAKSSIDAILVGDSAAMVMHGFPTTINATVPMMVAHVAAVARGAGDKLIVADLPFLSYRKGISAAMDAAQELMAAGAHALKLEGVSGHEDVIERLTGLRDLCQLIAAELSGVLPQLLQQPVAISVREAPDDLQKVSGELRIGHGSRLSPSALLRIGTGQTGVEALGLQVSLPGQSPPKGANLTLLLQPYQRA